MSNRLLVVPFPPRTRSLVLIAQPVLKEETTDHEVREDLLVKPVRFKASLVEREEIARNPNVLMLFVRTKVSFRSRSASMNDAPEPADLVTKTRREALAKLIGENPDLNWMLPNLMLPNKRRKTLKENQKNQNRKNQPNQKF